MPGLRKIPGLGSNTPRSPGNPVQPPPPGPRPLPDLGRPTQAPRGPMHLRLGQKRQSGSGGPGEHPADFAGSQPEWVWYWASAKYHKNPRDPRQGPFLGGELWQFQVPENPAAPRLPGGSVSDFVYLTPGGGAIIVRIEGTYFHLEQGGAQAARDLYLIAHAGTPIDRVVRINDTQFMADVSGATAVRLVADVLAGRAPVGQAAGGTVLPPRYADFAEGVSA
jgi:hypothetical protein